MASFRIDQVAELARQMQFTPREKRELQLTAAEALLLEIDPAKAYPFDFVVFRITAYHPKHKDAAWNGEQFTGQVLAGRALLHDLGLLIDFVSDGLDLVAAAQAEPVLTIDEMSRKFKVTTKTIQRWRRVGLGGRRFIFADGEKQVGFFASRAAHFISSRSNTAVELIDAPLDEKLARRLDKLSRWKIKFIDDPLYHQPASEAASAIEQIMSAADSEMNPVPASTPELERAGKELPAYMAALYQTPLLTPAKERALFLKFNFHKYQFVTLRRRLDPQNIRPAQIRRLEICRRRIVETKNQIVAANLRLVVNVARKHQRPGLSLMELISDGNMTLMRAVESFDFHKGNRLSTYATLALMKGFAREIPASLAHRTGTGGESNVVADVPDSASNLRSEVLERRDQVEQLLSMLSSRERAVIGAHFDLGGRGPATFQEIGHRMGLTPRLVRHIEQTALAKLRSQIE